VSALKITSKADRLNLRRFQASASYHAVDRRSATGRLTWRCIHFMATSMPYPKDHKARTRQTILDCAHRLFSAHGFEATSIEEIMQASQLTRGAFYAHFKSKAALYREAMGGVSPAGRAWLDRLLEGHAPAAGGGTAPWTFLAADVASKRPEVRAAYAQALIQLSEQLRRHGAPALTAGDSATLASTAMFVGALAIALSVDDVHFKNSLADACRDRARQLLEQPVPPVEPSFLWAVSVP
jgi:TetR/AcrR family transcriptional regulator, transcriptional repressor for nem operon